MRATRRGLNAYLFDVADRDAHRDRDEQLAGGLVADLLQGGRHHGRFDRHEDDVGAVHDGRIVDGGACAEILRTVGRTFGMCGFGI